MIRGFVALLDHEKMGFPLTAYVDVALEHPRFEKGFVDDLEKLLGVQECHYLAGEYAYRLKVKSVSPASARRLPPAPPDDDQGSHRRAHADLPRFEEGVDSPSAPVPGRKEVVRRALKPPGPETPRAPRENPLSEPVDESRVRGQQGWPDSDRMLWYVRRTRNERRDTICIPPSTPPCHPERGLALVAIVRDLRGRGIRPDLVASESGEEPGRVAPLCKQVRDSDGRVVDVCDVRSGSVTTGPPSTRITSLPALAPLTLSVPSVTRARTFSWTSKSTQMLTSLDLNSSMRNWPPTSLTSPIVDPTPILPARATARRRETRRCRPTRVSFEGTQTPPEELMIEDLRLKIGRPPEEIDPFRSLRFQRSRLQGNWPKAPGTPNPGNGLTTIRPVMNTNSRARVLRRRN